jgi:transcriptional regulator with XRE-family HTH domain
MLYRGGSNKGKTMKKKSTKKKPLLSEQLKERVNASELSRYRISKESGVAQSTISGFMNGHRSLSLANIDKIGEVLDLELVQR